MATLPKFKMTFNGTKAEFIAAGHNVTYNDYICFIKDSANAGAGACIYTKGVWFANFAELIAALAYVKGVSINGKSYNAANGGGYLKFEASDPSTVAINASEDGITIGLTPAFVKSVNDVIAQSSEIAADYLKAEDRTALEQLIANAKSELLGNASTDTKDSKTIEGVRKYVDDKTSGIASEGVVSDLSNRVGVIENDYLKAADKNELAGRIKAVEDDYLKAADKTELAAGIKANSDAIAVLNGNSTTDGSVDKKVSDAINAFASAATDNGTIDTFKELVEYVASHGPEFAELVGEVDANTNDIATLKGDVNVAGSVDKKIADAIADLASDGELAAVSADVATLKGQMGEGTVDDRISAAKSQADTAAQGYANAALDSAKTYAEGEADTAEQNAKSYADGLAVNYATAAQGEKADAAAPASTVYTKEEINSMFDWVEL